MRIGVDLGGTKIEAVALSEEGRELVRRRVRTPAGGYETILRAITSLVLEIESAIGERGSVGIGTPGALSPATGLIKNSNSTALTDKPLDRDLERLLARPLRFANDANCFALSEAVDGAAAGAEVVFGVILGTGTAEESFAADGCSRGEMPSPASGGTTPFHGLAPRSYPAPHATVESRAASRRFFRAQACSATTSGEPASASPPRPSRAAPEGETRAPWQRWSSTKIVWREASPTSSMCSTRTRSCSAVGWPTSIASTKASGSAGAPHLLRSSHHAALEGKARRCKWCPRSGLAVVARGGRQVSIEIEPTCQAEAEQALHALGVTE